MGWGRRAAQSEGLAGAGCGKPWTQRREERHAYSQVTQAALGTGSRSRPTRRDLKARAQADGQVGLLGVPLCEGREGGCCSAHGLRSAIRLAQLPALLMPTLPINSRLTVSFNELPQPAGTLEHNQWQQPALHQRCSSLCASPDSSSSSSGRASSQSSMWSRSPAPHPGC